MKYRKLSKKEILISLDRLTRFKNTGDKYIRVYSDILNEALIEPKIKKSDISNIDFGELSLLVSDIINDSLNCGAPTNNSVNVILKKYENSVYNNNVEIQKLLDNKINYYAAAKLITEDSPVNLRWLGFVVDKCADSDGQSFLTDELIKYREKFALKFPVEKVMLVEGITEEILLPVFCQFMGYDFYKKGIHVIAAGGKNQVVKSYYKLCDELKIPIYVLLDKDAELNIKQIEPKLRKQDKIHLVSCGEFEDLLPKSLIVKAINKRYENFFTITENTLDEYAYCDSNTDRLSMAKILEIFFRERGLYEFKKAEFAKIVRDAVSSPDDISEEIREIVNEIIT